MSRFIALIPAAGSGSRMASERPKQYLSLLGQPLIMHSLRVLAQCASIERVIVVLAPDDEWFEAECGSYLAQESQLQAKLSIARVGGPSRAASVAAGLGFIAEQVSPQDWILVHDAARPCLRPEQLEQMIAALREDAVGGLLALPLADTLKRADGQGRSSATVDREGLWRAQTPQMFRHGMLLAALEQPDAGITDEASAIEAMGFSPKLVPGSERNLKVTYPDDLALAALYLQATGA